jgi:hypothetical protein
MTTRIFKNDFLRPFLNIYGLVGFWWGVGYSMLILLNYKNENMKRKSTSLVSEVIVNLFYVPLPYIT